MCGRYWLEEIPAPVAEHFHFHYDYTCSPRYNIAPQSTVFTIFQGEGNFELAEMHWGILPLWAKAGQFDRPLINARCETIWDKPSFRSLVKSQRCVIPATGFFEWQRSRGTKIPHAIRINSEPIMLLGGIYQITKEGEMQHCVVTTQANEKMSLIHDRQPVIFGMDEAKAWITSGSREEIDQLMSACPGDWLDIYPVSTYVNNARNQGSRCIEPV